MRQRRVFGQFSAESPAVRSIAASTARPRSQQPSPFHRAAARQPDRISKKQPSPISARAEHLKERVAGRALVPEFRQPPTTSPTSARANPKVACHFWNPQASFTQLWRHIHGPSHATPEFMMHQTPQLQSQQYFTTNPHTTSRQGRDKEPRSPPSQPNSARSQRHGHSKTSSPSNECQEQKHREFKVRNSLPHGLLSAAKTKNPRKCEGNDPDGIRTHVTTVKG